MTIGSAGVVFLQQYVDRKTRNILLWPRFDSEQFMGKEEVSKVLVLIGAVVDSGGFVSLMLKVIV